MCKGLGFVQAKPSKYKNEPTEVNGEKFASKSESNHYIYLLQLQAAGEITDIKLQPRFTLLPSFTDTTGKRHAAIEYVGDSLVTYKDGRQEVNDVKGIETKDFKIKRKLYCFDAPAKGWPPLKVIAFDNHYGWIETDELKKMEASANGKAKKAKQAAPRRIKS
jgi:hypothetical protein